MPVYVPHTDRHSLPVRRRKTVTHRPLPRSAVEKFGQWITAEQWEGLSGNMSPDEQAIKLQEILNSKLDEYCPTQSFRINHQDKPWMNKELKQIKRRKMREWRKNVKSSKYENLLVEFKRKFKAAAQKFMRKNIEALKDVKPGKAFGILKSMGAQPGECMGDTTFTLPSHQIEGLTDEQSAERIADYFASISQEYQPLDVNNLPDRVKLKLRTKSKPPIISELDCYRKIIRARKPQTGVPGDLPSAVIKEFSVELAKPLQGVLNKIIQTARWPDVWKMEYVTPIGKIPQPETEDDLRPIALTPFFSKVTEQFVVQWLLDIIGDKLDLRQYGGMKGNSITHYLIELLNFILFNQDNSEPTSVLACFVDFAKAFNRQDHSILVTKLSDMGVPPWLLKIVISFLTDRTMRVRYKGKTPSVKKLPGGEPQGALLGSLLFLVLVNDVGFESQSDETGEIISSKRRVKELNELHLKFVDDLTLAESIDMKTQLTPVSVQDKTQQDTYHERTGLKLNPKDSCFKN